MTISEGLCAVFLQDLEAELRSLEDKKLKIEAELQKVMIFYFIACLKLENWICLSVFHYISSITTT